LKDRPDPARDLYGAVRHPAEEILIVAKPLIPFPSLPSAALALAGTFLLGCLGGEIDTPPARYAPEDTSVVFVPPPDTTPPDTGDGVVAGSPGMLFDRLAKGEKWIYSQKGEGYSGATFTLEVLGDSVYGPDSVYVESIYVHVPLFYSSFGDTVRDYTVSGRQYVRKSDRENVRDTVTTLADIHYLGDSVSSAYRRDAASVSIVTGPVPDSLKAGQAWTVKAARSSSESWGWDGLVYASRDTSWTDTVDYAVRASSMVKVAAGTFEVLQVDWATRGSDRPSVGWYAPAAKTMIREYDGPPATADTTELSLFTVQ
jgi:hypothetical protein